MALQMKSSITAEPVARYVVETITKDTPLENRLRHDTVKLPEGGMISGADTGALLAILAQSVMAKNALEIGTFTGYTALKVANVLPAGGKLVCCDISEEWTAIGKPYWEEAGVADRIDLRLAPALETLNSLIAEGRSNQFDFAFIDADKTGYDDYYEACMKLIRPGGLITLDNMLRDGRVVDPKVNDSATIAIRKMNEKISRDSRVTSCLITIGDGVMLARKN